MKQVSVGDVFGRRLRDARKAQGLSTAALCGYLAEMGVDVDRRVISNIENGRRARIGLEEWLAISLVLGVPPVAMVMPDEDEQLTISPRTAIDDVAFWSWLLSESAPDEDAGDPDDRDAVVFAWGQRMLWQARLDGLGLLRELDDAYQRLDLVEWAGTDEDRAAEREDFAARLKSCFAPMAAWKAAGLPTPALDPAWVAKGAELGVDASLPGVRIAETSRYATPTGS